MIDQSESGIPDNCIMMQLIFFYEVIQLYCIILQCIHKEFRPPSLFSMLLLWRVGRGRWSKLKWVTPAPHSPVSATSCCPISSAPQYKIAVIKGLTANNVYQNENQAVRSKELPAELRDGIVSLFFNCTMYCWDFPCCDWCVCGSLCPLRAAVHWIQCVYVWFV